jgi:hypothetical protein
LQPLTGMSRLHTERACNTSEEDPPPPFVKPPPAKFSLCLCRERTLLCNEISESQSPRQRVEIIVEMGETHVFHSIRHNISHDGNLIRLS